MKSSNSVIRADQQQPTTRAWQPAALFEPALGQGQWTEVDPAQGAGLFGDLQVQPAASSTFPRSGRTILAWAPGELARMSAVKLEQERPEKPDREEEARASAQTLLAEAENTAANLLLAQAQAQQTEILREAQRVADQMVAEARQEIEDARQAAYQKGQEAALAEAASYLQAAHQVVEEVHAWQAALVQQSAPALLGVAREIAEKLFGEGVALDNQALQQNLNRLLTNAKILGDIIIYLNPQDAMTLDSAWREIRSKIAGNRIQIVPSETITRGGCFIEGQLGSVDARVETQLQAVLDTLSPDRIPAESAA